MEQVINNLVINLNHIGHGFCGYAGNMFVQSSVLIILLLIIDFLLRKHSRAVFRYCLWMLVFVKLILPPTLSLPTGIGYWSGDFLSANRFVSKPMSNMPVTESVKPIMSKEAEISAIPLQTGPVQPIFEAPTSATAAISNLPSLTWQGMVFLTWLVGILVFSILLIQRLFFVRSLLIQSESAKGRLLDILNQCRQQVGMHRSIELKLSNPLQSPAVCGLARPIILIPTSLLEKLSRDKLRAVLIHELAHIKRGDLWVNLAQTFLQIIYFYNPFVWLANAVVRRIREQAVDEMVLVALGNEAESYSNTLIDIAEMAFWKANLSLRLIGVAESKKALHRRIKHILTRPIPKTAKLGFLGLLVVAILAAVLLPMAAAEDRGQKTDDSVEKQFVTKLPNSVMDEGSHNLLMERKDILQKTLQTVEQKYNSGRATSKELQQAKIDLLRVESELFETPQKQIDILNQIVTLYLEQERTTKQLLDAGRITQDELNKVKLLLLDAENELARAKAEANEQQTDFKVTLPNGVTVELVGICEHPSEGKQWWRPDGSPLPNAPYEKTNSYADPNDNNDRQIAVRFSGCQPDDIGQAYKRIPEAIEDSGAYGSALVDGKRVPDLTVVIASFPENQNTVTIPLGVAAGAWRTCAVTDGEKEVSITDGDKVVRFEKANEKEGKSYLAVWHNHYDASFRLIVIDVSGNSEIGREVEGGLGKGVERYKYVFDIPTKEIQEFRFQTRPYHWVTFKNVSLRPSVKTDVQIEYEGISEGNKPITKAYPWNVKTDLSQELLEKRNKLLADADKYIRSGLVRLSEEFPQLKKTRDWERVISQKSADSRVSISLFHVHKGKAKTVNEPFPENERFSLLVVIQTPPKEPIQLKLSDLYPNLGLVGQANAYAGDSELELAMKMLVEKALQPIKQLNDSLKDVKTVMQVETEKSNGEKGKVVDGVDITPADFDVRLNQERGVCNLVVSIQNESGITIPKFKLKFYRGSPSDNLDEAGNVHSGWHEAGPIEPGKRWNECTRDFHLPDGQYEFNVFLDFDNSVSEIDENNNRAVLQVRIEDGNIVEKSVKEIGALDK